MRKRTVAKIQKKCLRRFRKPLLYPFELWGQKHCKIRRLFAFRHRQIVNDVDRLQHLCNTSRMKATASRKPKQSESWPRRVSVGRESVTVYRRKTPLGNFSFMVANYADGKRRFDSYTTEADALDAAGKLARQLSARDVIGASMTKEQSVEYSAAAQSLQPLGITLSAAVAAIVEIVKLTGDLSGAMAAARFFKAKHKTVTANGRFSAVPCFGNVRWTALR